MFKKFTLFILLSSLIFASDFAHIKLQSTYYIDSDEIYISHIIKDAPRNKQIYKITEGRYTKRVKSQELLKLLKENGYRDILAETSYVKFVKKSPINTSNIVNYLKLYYQRHYRKIEIKDIKVQSRGFLESLPKNYIIEIRDDAYLAKDGILSIKTPKNKKIYFNFIIDAKVFVYTTKETLARSTALSALNTIKKSIILDKFMAKPIEDLEIMPLESRHHLQKDSIITSRDVEILSMIKRNQSVNVSMDSKNMSITFSARALKDAKMGDTITVEKANGTRLKVVVIGKNRAILK
ncbi:MAG: flagellar basal body P-ring formation chaperone FlgA [Sulfurimonas sp.]|uniref:flagellar basal body P-ring formation chaperone FlgA n=1 Tax=Sulfurimonas sp. TaxID=2022749 RepID=UPI0025F2C7A1|nr:flagellar basal body P-ring formation chaperone FlgA [Sulfurimonas sp.]MCK9491765.1 flagellar basal body P-ring formation chaperone FlgA [Sulfurimonas sp.]